MTAFVSHYHGERHHQGLGGQLIVADESAGRTKAEMQYRDRLGGILKFYYRAAA
jgi:putative transposase